MILVCCGVMQEEELAKLKAELADMEAEDEALKVKRMQVRLN